MCLGRTVVQGLENATELSQVQDIVVQDTSIDSQSSSVEAEATGLNTVPPEARVDSKNNASQPLETEDFLSREDDMLQRQRKARHRSLRRSYMTYETIFGTFWICVKTS